MRQLEERAIAAGLDFSYHVWRDGSGEPWIVIALPSGRKKFEVRVRSNDADEFAQHSFERWTVIDGYCAILDRERQELVASLETPGAYRVLRDLSGVTDPSPIDVHNPPSYELRLTNPDGSRTIELSTGSRNQAHIAFGSNMISNPAIRITNVTTNRHDEAKNLLLNLSTALFFELAVSHDVGLRLAPTMDFDTLDAKYDGLDDRDGKSQARPRYPASQYPMAPLNLYLKARTYRIGTNAPLSEYLSYYQVIEYFLPMYSRRETVQRVKHALKDPRLDIHDDASAARIVAIVESTKNCASEREQLSTAIAHCCTNEDLASFIDTTDLRRSTLASKKGPVRAPVLQLEQGKPLTSQVAERIYHIRCRIVHAKDSYPGIDTPSLLPFDPEAQHLYPDLALVRYVAERALISAATPMKS